MHDPSNAHDQYMGPSPVDQGWPGLSTMTLRKIDLFWPEAVAILVTICSALMSSEYGSWLSVAVMCGPQAILYALVERVRQRRALRHGHFTWLLLTSPLVLLLASVAWWIILMVLTRGNAIFAV